MEEIRVLITTDNHLGFAERDHIRGEDSFRAFEEVFEHARDTRADCILICGDLFHEVSPSKYTIYRTLEILQRNILGDKPIHIECIDNKNFLDIQKRPRQPNYYNPNINIEMPVFAIHGNHDEPSGHKGITALDIFAEAGLINYFGAMDGKTHSVQIRPLVLKKQKILLNLFGMGGIRDEAMTKLLVEERVSFDTSGKGTNVLIIHQTRCGIGNNSYVPEDLLSTKMDLVVWGHMHQSEPQPVMNHKTGFHTIQPGSTVQTSLCKAESGHKHSVLLKVTEDQWSTVPIRMKSTRSLVFKTIAAQESSIEDKIRREMTSILEEYRGEHRPLIRLRVEVDGSIKNSVVPKRTIEEFKDKIANPKDALRIIHKKKQISKNAKEPQRNIHKNPLFTVEAEEVRILSKSVFMQSIMECIDKENKFTISQRYSEIVQEVEKVLNSHRWTDIEKEIDPAVREIEKRLNYSYHTHHTVQPVAIEKARDSKSEEMKESRDGNVDGREEYCRAVKMCSSKEAIDKDLVTHQETDQVIFNEQSNRLYTDLNENTSRVREDTEKKSIVSSEEKQSEKSANSSKRQKIDYTFSSLWD